MVQLRLYAVVRPSFQKTPPDVPQVFSVLPANGENKLEIPFRHVIEKNKLLHYGIYLACKSSTPSLFLVYQ